MSLERILLIAVSVLLVIAIIFIAVSQLTGKSPKDTEEPTPDEMAVAEVAATLPAPPPTFPPADATVAEPASGEPEASPTSGVQRLVLEPTPTPFSVNEDDPRSILDLGNPDHTDFFNNDRTWYTYGPDKSSGKADYAIEDGNLLGTDFDAVDTSLYWSYNSQQSGNVYAEISVTNGDCAARDAVGLVIRIQPDATPSGYSFEVSCDGEWRLIRFRPAGGPTATQIDWTPSDAIIKGSFGTNRLGIWGYYGKFFLFINNTLVGEHFDPSPPYSFGYFAAYVRSQVSYPLTARFDDFAFWHIPFIP